MDNPKEWNCSRQMERSCNLEESFIEDPICPVCRKSYPAGSTYCIVDGTKLVSPDKLIPKLPIPITSHWT